MSTAPTNPPRMTMGAPRKRRASYSTGSTPSERQKYALDALGICDPAQLQYADGLRNARSTCEPDKTRSPRRHAAQPEPDDPMRDKIIPPKVFGLSRFKDDGGQHRDSERPQYQARKDKYEDETEYPKDPLGHDMDDEARVWRIYLEEARSFDQDIVIQASESLELLLVFAGLFSAVLTTFVAQTSQSLSPDSAAQSAGSLAELTRLVRAIGGRTSVEDVPQSASTSSGAVSNSIVWVNGLWFVSLTLSLATAIFAVLAKQWTRQYILPISGSSKERCLIRQFRCSGLEKWHFTAIIGLLPIPLHLSLILFLVGLVIFLIPLHSAIAIAVGTLSCILVALYLATIFLPLLYVECPFRTPFSDVLYHATRPIAILWQHIRHELPRLGYHARRIPAYFCECALWILELFIGVLLMLLIDGFKYLVDIRKPTLDMFRHAQPVTPFPRSLRGMERQTALSDRPCADTRVFSSLVWLFNATSHRSVKYIIQQSLGTLPLYPRDMYDDIERPFFDDKDYRPTTKDINFDLTQAEIDNNLRMLRTYARARGERGLPQGRGHDAIVRLVSDSPAPTQAQRLELRGYLEEAFRDTAAPLALPICAWEQLCIDDDLRNVIFTCLQGPNAALRMYDEIYTKVKNSLGTDDAWKVISHALLDQDGTEASPLTVITPKAFLAHASILFSILCGGSETARWDDNDDQLQPPTRFLLDMNQFFVITLRNASASQLTESHLEGLWKIIRAFVEHTSIAEDRAVCAAITKTIDMIINTEGPGEGLQRYPRFSGALDEMLEAYAQVGRRYYKPLSPTTSLLLRIAARRDRYHLFLRIGIENDDPEAYELFMNASPEAPTSQDGDNIDAWFVHSFAKGVARSNSPDAVETWKDEAARQRRCVDWFLDRERFASLVRQAGKYAEYWEFRVLDMWHPWLDDWYYEEVKRALYERRMARRWRITRGVITYWETSSRWMLAQARAMANSSHDAPVEAQDDEQERTPPSHDSRSRRVLRFFGLRGGENVPDKEQNPEAGLVAADGVALTER